jgi:hypothetical protein
MPLTLTGTHVVALQRALADGTLPPGMLQAMLVGPTPVSASRRRQTHDLSETADARPDLATADADIAP